MRQGLFVGFLSVCLASCTYQAQVQDTPSFSVMSNYGDQVAGLWLLYVDARPLERPIKPTTFACSAHKFPISVAGPFATSVRQTLDNVVDQIEVVQGPVTRDQLAARGAKGFIVVRGEEVRAKLEVKPGFWAAGMDSSATVIASLAVEGKQGRLLGTTVEGAGIATADAGAVCEGGAKALADAVGQGMGDTMRKLGEAVSNSERVRSAR